MVDMMQHALDFMAVYGLLAVFILLVLDGAALLPAFPGEVVLIIAVHQYADTLFGLAAVFAVAVGAAMVGSLIVYSVGRVSTGRKDKPRRKLLGMSVRQQEKMERLFHRPVGQSLVFFMRLLPVTRVLVSLPAGIARMPFPRFFVLSLLGMTVFYAGFLYLTFEFRDPDSVVAATATNLQSAAYESPAWTYVEANWIVSGAVLLLLGVYLSVRASRRMARDPEETSGSLFGMAARMVLFWGGIAVLVGLWLDPRLVYESLAHGGVDVHARTWGIPGEPLSLVAAVAGVAILVAWMLGRLRSAAKRKNRRRARIAMVERMTFEEVAPVGEEPVDDGPLGEGPVGEPVGDTARTDTVPDGPPPEAPSEPGSGHERDRSEARRGSAES